jgi:hypothetical protein
MEHRRSDSDESNLFNNIRSGDLLSGPISQHIYGDARLKTELTLPNVKNQRSDEIKREWLIRSNRLLEIVNKTSDIIADMRRCKIDKGYYKIPVGIERKNRKHSQGCRMSKWD